jgi:two-component system OmpR family response regulator
MRVLVVEDARRLLEILVRSLREEGFLVDGTPSGGEAVRLAATVPYDAIVLDVRLPDVDGFAVRAVQPTRGRWSVHFTMRRGVRTRRRPCDAG